MTAFELLCKQNGINVKPEFRFDASRRWRFDFAILSVKDVPCTIAVEIEGGVWAGGRHVNPKGFIGDMEKYNRATSLGWMVVRVQPHELLSKALNLITETFTNGRF